MGVPSVTEKINNYKQMNNNIDHKTLLNFSKGKYSYKDYLKVKIIMISIKNISKTLHIVMCSSYYTKTDKELTGGSFMEWGPIPDKLQVSGTSF